MSIIVEIIDRRNAQIATSIGVDKGSTEDEVHVKVLDILPQYSS